MRLSASRIRSINRRLAQVQGFTWPVHSTKRQTSPVPNHAPHLASPYRVVKIVAVPPNAAA
jgi:hypothetical protein